MTFITYLLIFLSVSKKIQESKTNTYCDLNCGNVPNTVCALDPCRPSKELCGKSKMLPLKFQDTKLMEKLHNERRNEIASGKRKGAATAREMYMFVYSKELAFSAQCWANQCTNKEDSCRITPHHFSVGQTIFWSKLFHEMNQTTLLNAAVNFWYSGYEHMTPLLYSVFVPNRKYNNFAQIIWDSTKYFGCGRTLFQNRKEIIIVCNYSPEGLRRQNPIYEKGIPCQFCKCDNIYKSLCYTDPLPEESLDFPFSMNFVQSISPDLYVLFICPFVLLFKYICRVVPNFYIIL